MLIAAPPPAPAGPKAGQRWLRFIPALRNVVLPLPPRPGTDNGLQFAAPLLSAPQQLQNKNEITIKSSFHAVWIKCKAAVDFPQPWITAPWHLETQETGGKNKIKGGVRGGETAEDGLSFIFNFNYFLFIQHTLAGVLQGNKKENGLARDRWDKGKSKAPAPFPAVYSEYSHF